MQKSQLVHARGTRWRVVDVRAYDACEMVTLARISARHGEIRRRLLTPFDVLTPIDSDRKPRRVSRARWRRACRGLLADNTPPGALRAALHARMDLLPHQLAPALAVIRGDGCRLLLADEVGLGKTIQAGLVAAELLTRGHIERLLIVAPAGLREQWVRELRDRFSIEALVAGAAVLRRIAATLPVGMNPWTTLAVAVTSIDYVKRPDVVPAVVERRWDLLIVDEAHGAVGDSDRHAAIQALARRIPYVLLLTATPHSGDPETFRALCDLGSLDDDALLVFRRTREQVRLGIPRRVRTLRVRLAAAERRMHRLLRNYTDALRAEHGHRERAWIAVSMLQKRAFSSAASLTLSAERRLAAVNGDVDAAEQLPLSFEDPSGEMNSSDVAPAWPADLALRDAASEERILVAIIAAAKRASAHESKLRALNRVLRRTGESAVVFTEFRDTLEHVARRLSRPCVVIHGGMDAEERSTALTTFSQSAGTVLLATDAAGEGLNLHHRCRLVINLELPWNPMRLEQRIGRVDRIGQRRAVHAIHLIARGTGEERVLTRLRDRVAVARAEIGAPDPLGTDAAIAEWISR